MSIGLLQADYVSWKSCSSSETWSSAWSEQGLPALEKHSCSWAGSRGSAGPVIHQINQAPRSNSRKRVQSKHCDPENDKWNKKPKEPLKKWYCNISLDHLLPQFNSSILHKLMLIGLEWWGLEKQRSSAGRMGCVLTHKADQKTATFTDILVLKLVKKKSNFAYKNSLR